MENCAQDELFVILVNRVDIDDDIPATGIGNHERTGLEFRAVVAAVVEVEAQVDRAVCLAEFHFFARIDNLAVAVGVTALDVDVQMVRHSVRAGLVGRHVHGAVDCVGHAFDNQLVGGFVVITAAGGECAERQDERCRKEEFEVLHTCQFIRFFCYKDKQIVEKT